MRTRYTFLADGEPVILSTSWESLALTEGTPIMFPEERTARWAGGSWSGWPSSASRSRMQRKP